MFSINTLIGLLVVTSIIALSYVSTMIYYRIAIKRGILAHPNARSSHIKAKPLGAGVVFMGLWGIVSVWAYLCGQVSLGTCVLLLPGSILLALVGYWDDRHNVSIILRLVIQIAVVVYALVVIATFYGPVFPQHSVLVPAVACLLGIPAMMWSINVFNFVDGLDGLAGSGGVCIFVMGGYLLWHAGGYELALLAWILAACIMGFLIWNWPPSKLFMGDSGSAALGYLVAVFALVGDLGYGVPLHLWLILYAFFWFDTSLTLVRRLLAGHTVTLAHNLHAYQRLYQSGWSHRAVALLGLALNLSCAALAFYADRHREYSDLALFTSLAILTMTYWFAEWRKPMFH